MVDLKVCNLDDFIASALKARAKAKGVSPEEEVRRTLTASVAADREELVRRAKALPAAAGGKPGEPELDSARTIREERMPGVNQSPSSAFERVAVGITWRSHGRHQSA